MTKRTKLYIAGKITGDDNYYAKFLDAENKLFHAGYYPANPAALVPEKTAWASAMKKALRIMLQCAGVALLPDWAESKGACIEARLAREVGIQVKPVEEWIKESMK